MVERILGGAIALAAIAAALGLERREVEVELWQVVAYSGAAFLAIGLVRDVWIKLARRASAPRRAGEKLICFESLAGALLVASGLALLGASVHRPFHPTVAGLALWGGLLVVLSGETKDLVIVFKREKDHLNVIPW
jgi:hypothetical protein